ncbi:MAG: hypothetical protein ABJC93_03995, partial [Roseobacter sp.]
MLKKLNAKLRTFRRYGTLALQQILGRAPNVSRLVIRSSELIDGKLVLSGNLLLNFEPDVSTFVVRKFRNEVITQEFPLIVTGKVPMTWRRRLAAALGLEWRFVTVTLDFPWAEMPSSIYGMGYRINDKTTSPRFIGAACRVISDDVARRTYCLFVEPSVRVP